MNKIEFLGYLKHIYVPYNDCWIYKEGNEIGYLQGMQIDGVNLHIEHFALATNDFSVGMGEECLREFTKLIQKITPKITDIVFDLGRAINDEVVDDLALKREKLFKRIGCSNIKIHKKVNDRIIVSARWPNSSW